MENSFKIDGEILYIDKERPSKEGSTFMLRDFALEMAMMGEVNHIRFQLKGTNIDKINDFLPGDRVAVSFSLLGMCKVKEDKIKCPTNPIGYDGFSPNANAWKIEFVPGFIRQPSSQQNNQPPAQNQPATDSNTLKNKNVKPEGNYLWDTIKGEWTLDDLPF